MKNKHVNIKNIMITIALVIIYVLGGSTITLPSYYNDKNQQCNHVIYGFQVFTECNGSYVDASIGGKKYINHIQSNDKTIHNTQHVSILEQLQRYSAYYMGLAYDFVAVIVEYLTGSFEEPDIKTIQ